MNLRYNVMVEINGSIDAMIFKSLADAQEWIYQYIREDGQMIDRIFTMSFDVDECASKTAQGAKTYVNVINVYYPKKMGKKEFNQLSLF